MNRMRFSTNNTWEILYRQMDTNHPQKLSLSHGDLDSDLTHRSTAPNGTSIASQLSNFVQRETISSLAKGMTNQS